MNTHPPSLKKHIKQDSDSSSRFFLKSIFCQSLLVNSKLPSPSKGMNDKHTEYLHPKKSGKLKKGGEKQFSNILWQLCVVHLHHIS